jgi:hypothetical protein
MIEWNMHVWKHEQSHVDDDRDALDDFLAQVSSLQGHAGASNQLEVKAKLQSMMEMEYDNIWNLFHAQLAADNDTLHAQIGAADPPPNCSCVGR